MEGIENASGCEGCGLGSTCTNFFENSSAKCITNNYNHCRIETLNEFSWQITRIVD